LAALEAREGDLESARESLRTLIGDYPAYVQSYVLLGQLFLQEGMREDGRQAFEQGMQVAESELLRIETELKTAGRAAREELRFDRQRVSLTLQSLSMLLDGL
jgi:predicted negative regulator of RcsB-dependent stress response